MHRSNTLSISVHAIVFMVFISDNEGWEWRWEITEPFSEGKNMKIHIYERCLECSTKRKFLDVVQQKKSLKIGFDPLNIP